MNQVEIGRGKRALRAYSFDDIYLSPSRRTRDNDLVSTQWTIDAYSFAAPLMSAPTDSVASPQSAVALGKLGILAVFPLEGLWTRHEDPSSELSKIAKGDSSASSAARLRSLYAAPIRADLVARRIEEIASSGVTTAAAVSPQYAEQFAPVAVKAGLDLLVVRGTTVSAEHVSQAGEPLNLKRFVSDLEVPVVVGGCATYQAALHLMRTGAAGVLVGFGGGAAHRTVDVLGIRVPMASAVADVAEARRDYLDESGGRYVHVIADGSVRTSGDLVKAIACGAAAVMIGSALARAVEAPGSGYHWGPETVHPSLPRGERVHLGTVGTFEQILFGPSDRADGTMNLVGALRKAMATNGYSDIKEFQRVAINVRPS
jgi:IMP dehydrogenase